MHPKKQLHRQTRDSYVSCHVLRDLDNAGTKTWPGLQTVSYVRKAYLVLKPEVRRWRHVQAGRQQQELAWEDGQLALF